MSVTANSRSHNRFLTAAPPDCPSRLYERLTHAISLPFAMYLSLLMFQVVFPLAINAMCSTPPDLWCDHPTVTKECAAERYCQAYKNNVAGRKFNLTLYFETHCPDSQLFIVDRLYPNVINDTRVGPLLNVDVYPWGMAKRTGTTVRCKHKRDRICEGNKFMSCVLKHMSNFKQKMEYLHCFEFNVMLRYPIAIARDNCYQELHVDNSLREGIRVCANGAEGDDLQKIAEKKTGSLAPKRHSFVPWITLNGRSLPEMQVYQLFLPEKLKMWTHKLTERSAQSSAAGASVCTTPPDFWCDDDTVTSECFDKKQCESYRSSTFGQPIKVTVIFNTHCRFSQRLIIDVLYPKVWLNPQIRPLVSFQLVPWGNAKRTDTGEVKCQHGPEECQGDILLACVMHHVDKDTDMVEFTECFLRNVRDKKDNNQALSACSLLAHLPMSDIDEIRECSKGPLGAQLQKANELATMSIEPEKKKFVPWVLFNDVSLHSAQDYAEILDRMACIWFRGPKHNRTLCSKCDFEPTFCEDEHPHATTLSVTL